LGGVKINFQDYEVVKLRKVRRIRIGRLLIRIYDVPKDAAPAFESTTLARGTILPGEAAAITSPYVKSVDYAQPPNKSVVRFVVTWIQAEPYS